MKLNALSLSLSDTISLHIPQFLFLFLPHSLSQENTDTVTYFPCFFAFCQQRRKEKAKQSAAMISTLQFNTRNTRGAKKNRSTLKTCNERRVNLQDHPNFEKKHIGIRFSKDCLMEYHMYYVDSFQFRPRELSI
jgi:hypothetical protein